MTQKMMKMALARTHMAWMLALVILHLSGHVIGVRITDINVPKMALEGDVLHLLCDYEEERGDPLYTFKWYKDGVEFYRHLPAAHQTPEDRCVGDLSELGVNVDCWVSSERDVVLKDVTLQTSGEYKCEVIGEHPKFRKEVRTSRLTVYSEPLQRPLMSGNLESYSPLDQVSLNCTSMNNEYFPEISWAINGNPAEPTFVHYYDRRTSGLTFQARDDLFQRGVIRVSCTVTLGKHHFDRTEVEIANRDYLSALEFHVNSGERRDSVAASIIPLLLLHWISALLFSLV